MRRSKLIEEKLTHSVIGAFYEAYNTLGFGFREHVYALAMERELRARGHRVAREVDVPVMYKGTKLIDHRFDMIVDEKLVIENKSTYELQPAASRQLHSYLKNSHFEIGLLLHFGLRPQFYPHVYPNTAKDKSC